MRVNKYFPFVFIYFFLNSAGLPANLLYTTLLTPLFYYWLISKKEQLVIVKFIATLLPFAIVHFFYGVDAFFYFKSVAYYLAVYIFVYTCAVFAARYWGWPGIFEKIVHYNFVFTLLALLLFFTPYQKLVWYVSTVSGGLENFPRLALLTYEASYYSTLLVPFFALFFLRLLSGKFDQKTILSTLMVCFPLVLSFSLGVLSCLVFAFVLLILFNASLLLKRKAILYSFGTLAFLGVAAIIFLFVIYPENPLTVRVVNVLSGVDSSGKGRTFEAFQLGYQIAEAKNVWFGVGPGQVKVAGDFIIRRFYSLPATFEGSVTIPCAFAETLAIFGLLGAGLRFFIEIFLFFRTRVYSNYFRFFLFCYMFIYQFTGSFITNIAEYVIWVFAFVNVFPEFDKQNLIAKLPAAFKSYRYLVHSELAADNPLSQNSIST